MTELIKQTLLKKRDYEAEYRFLQQYLSDNLRCKNDNDEDTCLFHKTGVSSAGTNSFSSKCCNNTSEIIKRHDDQ